MKVCIYGSGGVGGYFGARLAASGADVTFVARGDNYKVLSDSGLIVSGISGELHLPEIQVVEHPAENSPYQLVIVAVKAWQVRQAGMDVREHLEKKATVVPLQNGVDASNELAQILGEETVVIGLCGIVSFLKEPGHVHHAGVEPFIKVGERDGSLSKRITGLVDFLNGADGISASAPDDIRIAYWLKFMFIVTMSGIGALTRAPLGITRENLELRSMMRKCATEVFEIAQVKGVPLPSDSVESIMKMIDEAPAEATASMQRDIMVGKPSELYSQNVAVARLGREAGVATPINDMIGHALTPQERKARGELEF